MHRRPSAPWRRENRLIRTSPEQNELLTEELIEPGAEPVSVAEDPTMDPSAKPMRNGRREARVKRRDDHREVPDLDASASLAVGDPALSPIERDAHQHPNRGSRRNQQQLPRAPRADRRAVRSVEHEPEWAAEASTESPLAEPVTRELDAGILIDPKGRGVARVATRARKRQQAAATAVDNADDNPALGALNRHLNMMMQQLTAAHRVIGRVAAERDALRQQLAELQGVPIEEIFVSTIGASTEAPSRPVSASQPPSESRLAKLNYFGGDDIALMRKRRQTFVLMLAVVGAVLAVVGSQLGWSMPEDFSRDSLSALPILGNLMTVFLAGWVIFRIVRVGGKGVRWVFPTEDRRRRRR